MSYTDLYDRAVSSDDYEKERYKNFCDDMENAGLELRHYDGRYYYHGPAVVVDNIQDALSKTKVPCQWDNMGLDYIVYPE